MVIPRTLIALRQYKESRGSSDLAPEEEPARYQLVGEVMAHQGNDG